MQIRAGSRAWKSGGWIAGVALIGSSCQGGNLEEMNTDDSSQESSSAIAVGDTTAYEAESLARMASVIGSKVTSEAAASGGKYVEFNGTAATGAWIEFTLTNIAAGSYDLKMLYKSNSNRGIVQASVDGINQGTACNEYAATPGYKVACGLGSTTLTAGSHKLRFTVTGKASSSAGYQMVVDQIALTFKGATCAGAPPPQFAQNPQSYTAPCNSTEWVTFTAAPASGTTVSSVQWYVQFPGGQPFAPASTDKYHTGQTTLTMKVAPQDSQYVWCTITDNCGVQVSSSHALLTVPSPDCGCAASSPATGIARSSAAPICAGTATTLAVSGGSLGTSASWVWYTSSAHTTSIGRGPSITVSPTSTTTYYVRAEGPCGNTADASTTVSIVPPPQFAQNPQSYTAPCNSTDWVTFTAAPSPGTTVSSIQWFYQYPGGSQAYAPDANDRYRVGWNTLNLKVAPQSSQYVWCTIIDACGAQASSSHALLTVPDSSSCL